MKICASCLSEKDESEFNFKDKANGILQASCKICTRAQSKKYYQSNVSAHVARATKSRRSTAAKFKEMKQTLKCACCDENDYVCLDFHHKDASTKEFTVSYMIGKYGAARIQKEIDKCVVLCCNCHRKVHACHINLESGQAGNAAPC